MATDHCDACRHQVPAGRWCNRCGARLAASDRPRPVGRPWHHAAVATGVALVVAVGALAVGVGDRGAPPRPSDDTEVVLDGAVTAPVPDHSLEGAGPATVERPVGSSNAPPRGCSPAPGGREVRTNLDCSDQAARTDVVCSDLRVRSVPSGQLVTTREGALVELGHGTCVVMGREGSTPP